MTINVTIPQLNNNTKSTKDKTISLLSQKWPLNAKQIYNALQREHGAEVSYQAVHKLLHELQEEKILEKNGKNYQISKGWIQQVKRFGGELENNYLKGTAVDYESLNSLHLTFNNYVEFGKFLVNEYFTNFPNKEKKDCVCFWKHCYPLAGISDVEHKNMKKVFSNNVHYGIAKNNTFLDNLFASYLGGLGKRNICGVDFSLHADTFIMGDFICQVIFEPTYYKKMEQIYKNVKSVDAIDFTKLFEFASEKTEINALITKNASLADKLREEARKIYEENKK
jgi:hypothetical protein